MTGAAPESSRGAPRAAPPGREVTTLPFAPATPLSRLIAGAALGALVGGTAGVALYTPLAAAVLAMSFAILAAVSIVDVHERRIPNALTYPGTLVALLATLPLGSDAATAAGAGLLVAGGVLLVFWFVGGGGKLGLGDVKLSAFAGAVLGLGGVPLYLVVGVTAGAVGAAAMLIAGRSRRATMPYGPFLALGAAVALLLEGPVIG